MKLQVEKKDKGEGELEFTITIPFSEQKKILEKAANKISSKKPVKGFRPGKAPYEAMERAFGGETILSEALEELVSKSYYKVLSDEKINALGSPQISIVKQAYENELVYKAVVSLLPEVVVGNIDDIKIKAQQVNIPAEEIDKALADIRKLRAQEVAVEREARRGDMVEIDFFTTLNKVPLEGGDAKKYPIVLGDQQMIPGFEEKIEGMKIGQEKVFKLKFPQDYKADLANKEAEFKVKLLAVRERKLPELNDQFAQGLGQKNLAELKKMLRVNIEAEAKRNEEQHLEMKIFKAVVERSKFGPIPPVLITNEVHRITHEIEDDLRTKGIQYADYLKNLGKSQEDFSKELKPRALERVKTALISRQLAVQENIKASQKEIDQELELTRQQHKDNQQVLQNIEKPEYKEYISNVLTNRRVIEWLKKKIIE